MAFTCNPKTKKYKLYKNNPDTLIRNVSRVNSKILEGIHWRRFSGGKFSMKKLTKRNLTTWNSSQGIYWTLKKVFPIKIVVDNDFFVHLRVSTLIINLQSIMIKYHILEVSTTRATLTSILLNVKICFLYLKLIQPSLIMV